MPRQAVLLLAHGTPETLDQIPEYLRNVVSGRAMPQHVVEEIQHRYALIGRSPLTELTMEQGRLVEAELAAEGHPVRVYVGMRNWRPYIPDVVKQMRADGVEEAAVICLAPQNPAPPFPSSSPPTACPRAPSNRSPPKQASRVNGPLAVPIPMPKKRATPPSWLPNVFQRFPAGGLLFKARAPALDRGSVPLSKRP